MSRKFFTILVAIVLAVTLWGGLPAQPARAALTSVTINYYPAYIPDNGTLTCADTTGTPFALYVTVTGDPNQWFTLNVALAGASCVYDAFDTTWEPSGGIGFTEYPSGQIDGDGTVSMWLYARMRSGGTTSTSLTVNAFQCTGERSGCSSGGINNTVSVTDRMDMTTEGGWLEESSYVANAGRIVAVKSGATLVGLYAVEINNVPDGYPDTNGYYKLAAPACASCGYTVEVWNASAPNVAVGQVNTMGGDGCPSGITAGATTSLNTCGTPTAITLQSFAGTSHAGIYILLGAALLALFILGLALRRRARPY